MAQQQRNNGKPKPSTTERIDRQLAAGALAKHQRGEKPTREEVAALRRIEKSKEESQRWDHYRSISQKDWREMSGRQRKILVEQAEKYGIPFGGATIDLPAVVKSLHDFLAKYSHKLTDDDPLMCGSDSPALERYRLARAKTAELDLAERQNDLLRRDRVREGMAIFAGYIRMATEVLRRTYGADAQKILSEHIDDALRATLNYFGQLDDPPISIGKQGDEK